MLMKDFHKWRMDPKNCSPHHDGCSKECFEEFYCSSTEHKSLLIVMQELAYQIYELQVCIDGLIEDQEFSA